MIMSACCEGIHPIKLMEEPFPSMFFMEDFLKCATLTIYGHPDADGEDLCDDALLLELKDRAVRLCEISVVAILGRQLALLGERVYEVCDGFHADLEYATAALEEVGEEVQDDILYIDALHMAEGFDTAEMKMRILDELPHLCLYYFGAIPKIIAYYPLPLPYDDSKEKTVREERRMEAERKVRLTTDSFVSVVSDHGRERTIVLAPDCQLTKDELALLTGRKLSGAPYPEEAKNRHDLEAYEACGFIEAGDSRLYYKITDLSQ